MKATVIVPAFGKENLLEKCLSSLKKSVQGSLDYDVCVIDDGSGIDETEMRIKVAPDYDLLWQRFDSPESRGAARNQGIKCSGGDIVIFMDADMEAHPGFISAHIKAHEINKNSAVLGKILWPEKGSFYRYTGSRGVAKLKETDNIPPWYFVTGNASIERKNIISAGMFDESFSGWGGEDLDLGMNLAIIGVKFVYEKNAVSFHNFSGNIGNHLERTRVYGREAVPVLLKRHPELYSVLRLNLAENPFIRFLLNPLFYGTAKVFAETLNLLPIPNKLFDYLVFGAYYKGWQKGKKYE